MFIHREQFLLHYQSPSRSGQFCSPALIYAICATGACMSRNETTKQSAESFYAAAHGLLFSQGLGTPHITSVQALLCCAFYELSKGDFSRAWLSSGMFLFICIRNLLMVRRYGFPNGPGSGLPAGSKTLACRKHPCF